MSKNFKSCNFFKSIVAFSSTIVFMQIAIAQEQVKSGKSEPVKSLEEVVVTAEKRVETQQEIPAAFSVFSAEAIDKTGWTDVTDLATTITSLEIVGTTKSRTNVFIRGIGTNKYDIGTEGSVGVFLDGVYVPRFSSVMQNLIDVERIEVLRGPQGTLYGRNTIGGAISIYTTEPSEEFTGKISVGAANEDSHGLDVVVSGPLIKDKLLGYISASKHDTGGFRKDTISGEDDDSHSSSVRTKLRLLATDELTFDFNVDYSDEETDAFLGEPIFAPNDPGIFAINPLYLIPLVYPTGLTEIAAYKAREEADMFDSEQTFPGSTDVKATQYALVTSLAGDDINTDITLAYRDETNKELADTDRVVYDIYSQDSDQDSQTTSLEFKVSSEDGGAYSMNDDLQWLAGVFLYKDDAKRTDNVIFGQDSLFAGLDAISQTPGFCAPVPMLPTDIPCVPGGLIGVPAPYNTATTVDLETTSWAVFGQATYAINEQLALTLGIRHSEDTKDYTYTNVGPAGAPFYSPFYTYNFTFDDELNFESTDPKVVLEWEPSESEDVMLYVSYQQGYKSGGIQFATADESLAQQSFDKETLIAKEAGIKSRWFDDRVQLNGSVYHYDYEDQQIDGLFENVLVTSNAGKSTMDGVEVDVQFQATEALLLQASYSYLEAVFDEYFEASTNTDYSGRTLPAAPMNSVWLSAEYTHEAVQGWEGTFRLDYSWQDDQTFTPNGALVQSNYELVNAGYTVTSPDEVWKVRLYCSNCSDQEYYTASIPLSGTLNEVASTGDLRRYGVTVTYQF